MDNIATVTADSNAPPITRMLAEFVATHPSRGWSDAVEHEAHRTFLNWLGCAVGGARHPAVDAALAAVNELAPAAQAPLIGRAEKVDMANAAMLNAISAHVFDFDDTHPATLIHPAAAVASALVALAAGHGASGRQMIDALVLGIDVGCRVGSMMYPEHYDRGWHITGSTGALGAAAACARLLGLDADRTAMALGMAASQPIGLREQFGTMSKAFHPGAAAHAGLMCALMARHGYTASPRALEAPRGYVQVLSPRRDWGAITAELGRRFEISFNTYKPFACGLVVHPAIDGCVRLRNRHGLRPEHIARVELKVHPLVLELTGKSAPKNGLEGKFSIYHACAVGLAFGAAAESEFQDAIVNRADIVELRQKIIATIDPGMHEAAADVTVHCGDGRRLHQFIGNAVGSLEQPMSDDALNAKFDSLASPVLGAVKSARLRQKCWDLAVAQSMNDLLQHALP